MQTSFFQVELVVTQFKRAKGRLDAPDASLHEDLSSICSSISDTGTDPAVLKRIAEKLQLMKIDDLTQESVALTEMISTNNGDCDERIEKMWLKFP